METFSPEDILVDNLSFKLNKGASYITDRRSVSFFPTTSNVYKPSSGARVLKFSLNGEDNSWLDPQSVRICFTLSNKDGTNFRKIRPLSSPYSFFRRMRIIAGSQVLEDFDNYNRVHHMFSKMMSQGARRDEANEGFGYRYDDELLTLVSKGGSALTYEVNSANCPGFYNEMTCCFKPLAGIFSQFKYLPLKYMGNLTIELELVNNATDCIINPNDFDESDSGINADIRNRFTVAVAGDVGKATNTSIDWEISNPRVICDVCTLDNNLNNEYVKHLLEGKGLPITYTTYITQSQNIKGSTDNISVPVIRSVSKLVASFITFYKSGDPSLGYEYADKEFCRFYHPHQAHDPLDEGIYDKNLDLEFQIQLGSKLYPEYPCNSITQCFYHLRKALNLPMFHQHSMNINFKQYRDRQFIFGFSFEKVPDSSYTGINTRAGQQMLLRVKPAGATIPANDMPDTMYITMLSEQILEIKDLGLKVFD